MLCEMFVCSHSIMSTFAQEHITYWQARILDAGECLAADRVSLICDFLLRNEFMNERNLRHASDPSKWEHGHVLVEGMLYDSQEC